MDRVSDGNGLSVSEGDDGHHVLNASMYFELI